MNTDIQVFKHAEFGQIRICINNGKVYYCLNDVCRSLEIGNNRQLKTRLSQRGVITNDTPTYNQHGTMVIQQMTYIDEANMYRCIFKSRKPEAERYQNWVFEEVLPQIHTTGSYSLPTEVNAQKIMGELQKPEYLIMLCKKVVELDEQVQILTPMAEYAEEVLLSPTCYTMTQVAKSLSMTVRELQHYLRKKKVIYHSPSGPWMLYAPHLKKGYEAYRTKTGQNLFGETIWTNTYLVWTEQGKEFIHNLFNNKIA